jgi:hypothetical protein
MLLLGQKDEEVYQAKPVGSRSLQLAEHLAIADLLQDMAFRYICMASLATSSQIKGSP